MNRLAEAPRGQLVEGRAARRDGRPSRAFPRREYHEGDSGARAELVRVQTPQGERVVGAFVCRDGEEVLQKFVDADAHMLRYPCEAWAVDCRALEEASRRGVRRVVLYDKRVGTWWARLADFEEHGVPVNRDWGEQVALGLHWFSFIPLGSVTPQLTLLFAEAGG